MYTRVVADHRDVGEASASAVRTHVLDQALFLFWRSSLWCQDKSWTLLGRQAASGLIQVHSQGLLFSAGCELREVPPSPSCPYLRRKDRASTRFRTQGPPKKWRRFLGLRSVLFKTEVLVLSPKNGPDLGTAGLSTCSAFRELHPGFCQLQEVGFGQLGPASRSEVGARSLALGAFFLVASSGTRSRAPHCCMDAFHLRLKRLNHL